MGKYILGIETSCDETAAAVVENGRILHANVIRSSAAIHEKYGGVVPEIASREHVNAIIPVIEEALNQAKLSFADLAALAVCCGPGLLGSLIVGVSAAKALAAVSGKPLIPVHHLASHIAANYLAFKDLEPPFLALIVSGAHSHIVEVTSYTEYSLLARTRDDAPGEAYDKISREIGLAYPGGPKLDKLSYEGNPKTLDLPRSKFQDSLDFSFSGIKTATLNELNKAEQKAAKRLVMREEILSNADIAASFQEAVVDTLISHLEAALEAYPQKKLVLAGGVSANSLLRKRCEELGRKRDIQIYMPPLALCTDNAAMTAAQGYYEYEAGIRAESRLNASAMWELGEPFPATRKLSTEDVWTSCE